jgi:RsiW-degrading membrane proteinase PrsW (M82 family)
MIWLTIVIVFAILWVWAFYRADKRPEPVLLVLLAFACGAFALFPASAIEAAALRWDFLDAYDTSIRSRAALFLGVVGPVEEIVKFLPVWLFLFGRQSFDEPVDGIIYSAAAATGFATAENLKFMYSREWAPEIMLYRGPGGPFLHILFAGYWGITLGMAKGVTDRVGRRHLIEAGLVWAALMHGVFNLMTYSAGKELSVEHARIAMAILLVGSFLSLRWHMNRAQSVSVKAE